MFLGPKGGAQARRTVRRVGIPVVLAIAAMLLILLPAQLGSSAPPPTALQLNGSSQYVTFGAAPGLGAAQFTLETWFKRTGAGVGTSTGSGGIASAIPLVTKGRAEAEGTNVDMNYFLGIDATSGKLVADFEEGPGGAGPLGQNHPISGTTLVTSGFWHHAVATYDGTTWKLYLDGVLDGTLAVGQPPRSDSIQHAALGTAMNSSGVAAGFFAGDLDEVRIWNYDRTGAQIRAARSSELASAAGLVGRFGMNEGSGTTVANSAGSPNGSTVGSPTWITGYDFIGDAAAPAAPANLAATADDSSAALTWDANAESDLAGYDLYRSTTTPVSTSGAPLTGAALIQARRRSSGSASISRPTRQRTSSRYGTSHAGPRARAGPVTRAARPSGRPSTTTGRTSSSSDTTISTSASPRRTRAARPTPCSASARSSSAPVARVTTRSG